MTADQRHEAAHKAARKAVQAWIDRGDRKAREELIAALAGLAHAGATRRERGLRPGIMGRPRKRKAA